MRARRNWWPLAALPSFLLVGYPAPVAGQATDGAASSEPAVRSPELVHFEPAVYPPTAEAQGLEAVVILILTVDEAGRVTEAKSTSQAGHGFDEAAEAAAMRMRFRPAEQGGNPVAVRIRFRTVFELDLERTADTEPKPQEPSVEAPVATPRREAPSADENVPFLEFGATAEVQAPLRETTRRSLQRASLTKVPGTRGDALRAVEVLPGVSGVNNGNLVLRGAAHNESQVYLEGLPIPMLYHFWELTSVVPGRVLDRVDYYPGNFSVRYGRVSGGVVEARLRDPASDRLRAVLDLSLLDSSVLVEGPLGRETALLAGARRSNIDLVFEHLVPSDAYSVTAAPVYYDAQAMVTHRVGDQRLRFFAYGSRDSLELFISNPVEEDPALRGEVEGLLAFQRLHGSLEGPLSGRLEQRIDLAYGTQRLVQRIGALDAEADVNEIHARGKWQIRLGASADLRWGVDVEAQFLRGRYLGPPPPQNEGDPSTDARTSTQRNVEVDGSFTLLSPAAFVEMSLRPSGSLTMIPGVRVDCFGQLEQVTVDPRLAVRWVAGRDTTYKWGVGLFTQRPEYFRALEQIGNPDLSSYRAMHTSVGVERALAEGLGVEAEAFYKSMTDRVVAVPGGAAPYFVNDGVGRIYGLEISARHEPDDETFGYFAYTLSRSERRDRNEAWRLFDRDRTHVLSAALNRALGRGWQVGGRFRLVGGTPETPVRGAVFDLNTGQYVPVYGSTNSARTPLQHRLDVRVEKQWQVGPGRVAAYVDVVNVYNATQREGIRYAYDYRTSQAIESMPFFPNVGLRGEL